MKTIVILIISYIFLSANHISWHSNFEEAHHEALKSKKKLLVLLIDKDTPNTIFKDIFMDKKYIDEINQKYISVLVTKNQPSSYPIELLYTLTYPALFFLNENELFMCEPLQGIVSLKKLDKHLKYCQ